jgi:hypothetical protein
MYTTIRKPEDAPRVINSVSELLARLDGNKNDPEAYKGENYEESFESFVNDERDQDWAGTKGITDYISKLHAEVGSHYVVEQPDVKMKDGLCMDLAPAVSGQFHDVEAYLMGLPECMADFVEVEQNRYLSIRISSATKALMNYKDIQPKYELIASMIANLESAGVRCEVVIEFAPRGDQNPEQNSFDLIVKSYGDNYQPTYHGYILGNYSTVRGLGYAYWGIFNNLYGLGKQPDRQPAEKDGQIYISAAKDSIDDIKKKFAIARY